MDPKPLTRTPKTSPCRCTAYEDAELGMQSARAAGMVQSHTPTSKPLIPNLKNKLHHPVTLPPNPETWLQSSEPWTSKCAPWTRIPNLWIL